MAFYNFANKEFQLHKTQKTKTTQLKEPIAKTFQYNRLKTIRTYPQDLMQLNY